MMVKVQANANKANKYLHVAPPSWRARTMKRSRLHRRAKDNNHHLRWIKNKNKIYLPVFRIFIFSAFYVHFLHIAAA